MRDLSPYWLDLPGEEGVSFQLRPLDLRTQYTIQASIGPNRVPSWDGIVAAAEFIVGWKGLPVEFSRGALREILNGGADVAWMVRLTQIAGDLYAKSFLSETERKN